MRRFFALLSAIVLCLSVFSGCCHTTQVSAQPPSGPQLAQQISDSTVALTADFITEKAPYCTGVWVAKDTILTANHCVEGYIEMSHRFLIFRALISLGLPPPAAFLVSGFDPDPKDDNPVNQLLLQANIMFPKAQPMGLTLTYVVQTDTIDVGEAPARLHRAAVTAVFPDLDLALIQTSGEYPTHRIAHLAEAAPAVGEEIATVGQTAGTWWNYKKLTVSAYRHSLKEAGIDIQGPFMQVVGSFGEGDSGGGMFNDRGQLVGINIFVHRVTHYGFCVHLDTIRSVLIGQRLLKAKLDVKASDPDLKDSTLNLE